MKGNNMKEYPEKIIIEVKPREKEGTQWGNLRYFVKVDTDPNYGEELDTPIDLSWGESYDENKPISMEVDDAEEYAHAILRAVEIRRKMLKENKQWRLRSHGLPVGSVCGEVARAKIGMGYPKNWSRAHDAVPFHWCPLCRPYREVEPPPSGGQVEHVVGRTTINPEQ